MTSSAMREAENATAPSEADAELGLLLTRIAEGLERLFVATAMLTGLGALIAFVEVMRSGLF